MEVKKERKKKTKKQLVVKDSVVRPVFKAPTLTLSGGRNMGRHLNAPAVRQTRWLPLPLPQARGAERTQHSPRPVIHSSGKHSNYDYPSLKSLSPAMND